MPPTLEERVFESLLRAADYLLRAEVEVLREEGLTFPQYNVLRILRGAGPAGLSCGQIGERMMNRDSDLTRILDHLTRRGLTARSRDELDRRIVVATITEPGLRLLQTLDGPVRRVHRERLAHLERPELERLRALLESARSPAQA